MSSPIRFDDPWRVFASPRIQPEGEHENGSPNDTCIRPAGNVYCPKGYRRGRSRRRGSPEDQRRLSTSFPRYIGYLAERFPVVALRHTHVNVAREEARCRLLPGSSRIPRPRTPRQDKARQEGCQQPGAPLKTLLPRPTWKLLSIGTGRKLFQVFCSSPFFSFSSGG